MSFSSNLLLYMIHRTYKSKSLNSRPYYNFLPHTLIITYPSSNTIPLLLFAFIFTPFICILQESVISSLRCSSDTPLNTRSSTFKELSNIYFLPSPKNCTPILPIQFSFLSLHDPCTHLLFCSYTS